MPSAKTFLTQKWMMTPGFNAVAILLGIAVAVRAGVDFPGLMHAASDLVRAYQCQPADEKLEPAAAAPIPGGSILEHSIPATLPPGEWPAVPVGSEMEHTEPALAIPVEQVAE